MLSSFAYSLQIITQKNQWITNKKYTITPCPLPLNPPTNFFFEYQLLIRNCFKWWSWLWCLRTYDKKIKTKKTKQITRSGCYINITLGLKTHFFASLMKLKICKPVSSTIYLPLFPYYSTTILSIYRFLVCIITITLLPP